MSWFLSFVLAGTMFTSGNGLPLYEQINAVNHAPAAVPVVLDEREVFEQTYPFDPNGKIDISNVNGSIVIEAWDSPQIYLQATKIADTKERLADVNIDIDAGQSEFSVSTDYKAWKEAYKNDKKDKRNYSKLSVDFRLKVPRTAQLREIETINGSVEVSNMTSFTEVSAVNGSVKALNISGTAKLSTVNGTVLAEFDQLGGDSTIALNTVNGTVRLELPSNTNATVKADSVNGEISNDFGLPVRKGKYVGRDLYGRIGSGEVKVKLNSVNGGISIAKKNDGGTANPAVDLLPQKTADDFDDTFESRFESDMERINLDFERVLKESKAKIAFSGKEVETAMKALDEAIIAAKPEIAIDAVALARAASAIDREKLALELEKEKNKIEAELARASEAFYMGRSPFVEEKTGSFEVSGVPTVTVDAKHCIVRVRGWDKQEVRYSVTRLKRNADGGKVEVVTHKDGQDVSLEVKAVTGGARSQSEFLDKVRLEVFVPKKSNLRINTDSEVRLEGVTGELELTGSTGTVNVRDANGILCIDEVKGTVRVIGFRGEISTTAIKGDLYLEGDFSSINSKEGKGTVFLTLAEDASALITTNEIDLLDAVAVNDSSYKLGSLNLVRQEEGVWKVGAGAAKYNFEQKEGKLHVRPKASFVIN